MNKLYRIELGSTQGFTKGHRVSCSQVSLAFEVEATSPEQAMELARDFAGRSVSVAKGIRLEFGIADDIVISRVTRVI